MGTTAYTVCTTAVIKLLAPLVNFVKHHPDLYNQRERERERQSVCGKLNCAVKWKLNQCANGTSGNNRWCITPNTTTL